MRQSPNLWLETSADTARTGAYRVPVDMLLVPIVSSLAHKLPWQAVGPPHAELMYAEIDDDARRAIGTSNLERLLAMAAW